LFDWFILIFSMSDILNLYYRDIFLGIPQYLTYLNSKGGDVKLWVLKGFTISTWFQSVSQYCQLKLT